MTDEQHIAAYKRRDNNEWEVNCSCGAMWTHKEDETTEKMTAVWKSHLVYANRPKMQTL